MRKASQAVWSPLPPGGDSIQPAAGATVKGQVGPGLKRCLSCQRRTNFAADGEKAANAATARSSVHGRAQ